MEYHHICWMECALQLQEEPLNGGPNIVYVLPLPV